MNYTKALKEDTKGHEVLFRQPLKQGQGLAITTKNTTIGAAFFAAKLGNQPLTVAPSNTKIFAIFETAKNNKK